VSKSFLITGAVLAGLGVVLGAFGAHGLRKIVPPETVDSYQTGVQYQMYHAFALLVLGLLADRFAAPVLNYSGIFFLLGIIFFSGSIYIIAAAKATGKVLPKAFFLTTPLGGLMFIIGWLLLLVALLKRQ
jgi:uncharacterized membrane protein YgdD (TMEM256/DUF423 family)